MHIPDGFLSTPVWLALDAAALPAVGLLARRAQREMEEARIPLLGVMGAFVFAAQMVNFPVGVGTSGHLVGGALLTITLGPAAAAVVMTAILAVQAFVFQDGGILALGANVLNMAIAGVLAGYLPYHLWGAGRRRRVAIFVAAAVSVLASASMAILELLASGVPIPHAIATMSFALFGVSALIEGAITLAVVEGIERLSPRLIRKEAPRRSPAIAAAGFAAVLLAGAGALVASTSPDGLQKLADQLGISGRTGATLSAPLAGYGMPWLKSPWVGKTGAALAGLALVAGLCAALGRAAARRRSA